MFEKIEKINFTALDLQLFKENICTHSPVLNSKDINIAKTDKLFMGEIKGDGIVFWEKSERKRVIVPICYANLEDDALLLKITLPHYNRIMLKFWFLFLGLFSAVNICILPFLEKKLMFSINFFSGIVLFLITFFITKKLFEKRVKSVIDKIKNLQD